MREKTKLGSARRQDEKAYPQQHTGVTLARSSQPVLTNAGMGLQREHLLGV